MLKKVLVVDDSSLIHQMYNLVLIGYSCEILSAMNGLEALDHLKLHDDIQLILLDIHMPVMNGLQFMEKAAKEGIASSIPIIILSTEGKEEETARGLELGARGYLKKPFKSSDLHNLINKLLETAEGDRSSAEKSDGVS
jgi:two-component system chemotaxis response regulator CheY